VVLSLFVKNQLERPENKWKNVLEELGTCRRLLSLVSKRKFKYPGHAITNEMTNLMQGKIEDKLKKGRPATSLINIIDASGSSCHEISRR